MDGITNNLFGRYFDLSPEEKIALNTLSFGYDYGNYSVANGLEDSSSVNLEQALQVSKLLLIGIPRKKGVHRVHGTPNFFKSAVHLHQPRCCTSE